MWRGPRHSTARATLTAQPNHNDARRGGERKPKGAGPSAPVRTLCPWTVGWVAGAPPRFASIASCAPAAALCLSSLSVCARSPGAPGRWPSVSIPGSRPAAPPPLTARVNSTDQLLVLPRVPFFRHCSWRVPCLPPADGRLVSFSRRWPVLLLRPGRFCVCFAFASTTVVGGVKVSMAMPRRGNAMRVRIKGAFKCGGKQSSGGRAPFRRRLAANRPFPASVQCVPKAATVYKLQFNPHTSSHGIWWSIQSAQHRIVAGICIATSMHACRACLRTPRRQ